MSIIKILPDGSAEDFFSHSQVVMPGDTRKNPTKSSPQKSKKNKKAEEELKEIEELEKEREEFLEKYGRSFF